MNETRMVLPGKFVEIDLTELDALVAAHPFATLVTTTGTTVTAEIPTKAIVPIASTCRSGRPM